MQIIDNPEEIQTLVARWRCSGESIGFVPTMGALHEGHLALTRAARAGNTKFVSSIFVNPSQFAAGDDYEIYPRPFEPDCTLLEAIGCDVVFAPKLSAMYGLRANGISGTSVEVGQLGEVWEGAARPGHFRGVATVVAKLFNITLPHRAYFGEKDYQQIKVIEHMVRDLNFPLEIVTCPTVRESDGLALSSRNARLTPVERAVAPTLCRALMCGVELARAGQRDVALLVKAMKQVCASEPLIEVDYLAVVDGQTLSPLDRLADRAARILIAARLGSVRLIDNIALGL